MVQQPSYWKVLTRRKILSTEGHETETKLNRVLGLYDLTALGVGSTLGAGIYVLAGQIAKEQAGPSVMLSFAIAALASLLAGVCYAEFGARVPKAGSAYVYSYVCIGEFAAFVIGWNLILEYVIGTAAVCRGISLYLDTMINDTLKITFAETSPINVSFLGSYFDWFAFGLVVIFGVALAFGVETSAWANNFCTCLNISILLFVIIAGSIKANFSNWTIDINSVNATDVTSDLGTGGYFPFGFSGTLRGAATCFFGFVGFDCIATTGEEVQNPRKNIPRSILLSLLIIFLCYFGVSTVLTLMVPYYKQDPNAPLPYAFKEVGWNFAMWIVSIGGLIGLLASLFGALFPLPRVMYSMAEDGLLFHFLGKISPRFQVPVNGSIFAAIMTALIAGLFDLNQLVSLLSIGTLLAYSVVAMSVTILRYMNNNTTDVSSKTQSNGSLTNGTGDGNGDGSGYANGLTNAARSQTISEATLLTNTDNERLTFQAILVQFFNCNRTQAPNTLSTRIVGSLITVFCLLSVGIGLIFMEAYDALINNQTWVLALLIILIILTLIVLFAICMQPRELFTPRIKVFRVPYVPMVPAISIFINIYLILQLDVMTWIRFGVWMVIGIPMYIACYWLHDLKNPLKRNPNRIAYEQALMAGARGEDLDNYEGINKNKNIEASMSVASKSTSMMMAKTNSKTNLQSHHQNQLSLKSLDEIVKMSDVGEDLIEMRHPNGKVFYVEDSNRSNQSTLERKSGAAANDADAGDVTETMEEEKSVIALLDDVLQGEDDGVGALNSTIHNHHHHQHYHHYDHMLFNHDYDRKFSVDSAMLPSFIETTIVATVHSSSDSSEHDLDDVPEENEEQIATTPPEIECIGPLTLMEELRANCAQAAQELVNDILKNEQVLNILAQRNEKDDENLQAEEKAKELVDDIFKSEEIEEILKENYESLVAKADVESSLDDISKVQETEEFLKPFPGNSKENEFVENLLLPCLNSEASTLQSIKDANVDNVLLRPRKESAASLKSIKDPDPIHSVDFKTKLSKLIMQSPIVVVPQQKQEKQRQQQQQEQPEIANESIEDLLVRPNKLKHSKSEADVRKLLLKAIEDQDHVIKLDENGNTVKINEDENVKKTLNNQNGIPKPPKFDPVLYKTINSSFTTQKSRPGLEKLLIENKPTAAKKTKTFIEKENQAENIAVPSFKTKLEAILSRGPSHKSQQRPEVEIRPTVRAKTMFEIRNQNQTEKNIENYENERKKHVTKPPNHKLTDQSTENLNSSESLNYSNDTTKSEPFNNYIQNARISLKPVLNGQINS